MHNVIAHNFEEELERYLIGEASPAFQSHLASCPKCEAEVAEFAAVTLAIREFQADPEVVPEPSPAFYSRLAGRINERGAAPSGWNLFAPGAAFFQRIAFASLLVLAGLGSYLVSHEADFSGADAAAIMANYSASGNEASGPQLSVVNKTGRDHLLLTLATYRDY